MSKKKKICVLTATRAEYGLLKPVIVKLMAITDFDVRVAVTGMHLSPEFGLTYKEIENDGILIDEKIEILMSSDTPSGISKTMGLAMTGFADYFARLQPDMLLVLGDRYETLAVCCAAMNQMIPIVHLYGGETTEGQIDESIRHSITKMSYLHFTSTEIYRKRVIQLGENPDRVFNVGSLGIENIKNIKCFEKDEILKELHLPADEPYAVVTFHPVTLEKNTSMEQVSQLLKAISNQKNMNYIITKANSDTYGRIINKMIDAFAKDHNNCIAVASLGTKKYLSAMKYSCMVIGNSSSGIVEAPSFKIPTINIGDRQKGRIQAESVINCEPTYTSIIEAIKKAKSREFQKALSSVENPYEKDNTSSLILTALKDYIMHDINIKKEFYNIDFSI